MRYLALLLFALLSACGGGGGGDTQPVQIAVYGDSLSSGYVGSTRLSPTPVERLTEYSDGAFKAVDYSRSGMTAPETKLAGQEPVVVLRLGYADAVLGVTDADHAKAIEALVAQAEGSGRRVVIVGVLMAPDEYDARAQQFNAIQRSIAQRHGLQFVDVRSLGRVTMGDPIHPDRAGSDKVSMFIAKEIARGMK
jgi:hypothetical protein